MTDTPKYETEAIQNFVDKSHATNKTATTYRRLIETGYWDAVKEILGDDFSVLNDAEKAREFGYNVARMAILKGGLEAMNLSDELKKELEEKQEDRAFLMLTGGQFSIRDYAEQIVDKGEGFKEEASQFHAQFSGVYSQQDKKSLASRYLKDLSGEELYAAIGSPALLEGVTVKKLDFLKPDLKAQLINKFEKDDIVSPKDLENLVRKAFN